MVHHMVDTSVGYGILAVNKMKCACFYGCQIIQHFKSCVTLNFDYFLFQVFKLLGGKGCVLFKTISHAMLGVQYISLELDKEIDMEEDKVSHK